ncbi:LysR substrate-binding domain-containing protein [Proteus vulgaris]|uniref:LysR substrate-binding domain-containing protein n=1 Tax=Proteus TaxID=583 RepID=UPI001FC9AFA5|nr:MULTISPECIES: LysR substrate-binding domain-containing protein [Proteus]MDS0788478.1 LysR substrate-binding domain-containing protein [Proteus vulgaris]
MLCCYFCDIAFLGREYYSGSKEALHLLPDVIDCEELFRDTPLVYVRKDHPLLKESWNLETFLRYSHISTEYDKRAHWALDDILAEHGRLRNIAITYTSFEQALFMISQPNHELITCLPGYCVHYISRALPNLVTLPKTINEIEICYNPLNPVAKTFYSSFGFKETGMDKDGDDMLAVIKITQ